MKLLKINQKKSFYYFFLIKHNSAFYFEKLEIFYLKSAFLLYIIKISIFMLCILKKIIVKNTKTLYSEFNFCLIFIIKKYS